MSIPGVGDGARAGCAKRSDFAPAVHTAEFESVGAGYRTQASVGAERQRAWLTVLTESAGLAVLFQIPELHLPVGRSNGQPAVVAANGERRHQAACVKAIPFR